MDVHRDLPPYAYEREVEELDYVKCEVDGYHYAKSEMIFCKVCQVRMHRTSLNAYLEGIKGTVSDKEFNDLKTELNKQL